MTIILTIRRHYAPEEIEFNSVAEAAAEALYGMDFDQHFPCKIEDGDKIVWEFLDTPESFSSMWEDLKKLAGDLYREEE